MPRYYFDVHTPRNDAPDDEGTELPGVDAACAEAAESLVEMLKSLVVPCKDGQLSMAVRDESGWPVCEVRAQVRVTRH